MSSVPQTTPRASTNGSDPQSSPPHLDEPVEPLEPWGEFYVSEGQEGAGGEHYSGRGKTLDEAITHAVRSITRRPLGEADARLVWQCGGLKALVTLTPGGPLVTRLDNHAYLAELVALDALAADYWEARENLILIQRRRMRGFENTKSDMRDAWKAIAEAALRLHTGRDRDEDDETPFEPFTLETPRFLVRIEHWTHDLLDDSPPEYDLGNVQVFVIAKPGLVATEGGAP